VETHTTSWKKARRTQSQFVPQISFVGECTAYTDTLHDRIKPAKGTSEWCALPPNWPLYGPLFEPPTFTHYHRRKGVSECNPEWSYIKSVRILHHVFYPFLARCPK
ncbi:hypothetical protein LXA43DRAFT_865817, partial [Ganoderma leucocontextum]